MSEVAKKVAQKRQSSFTMKLFRVDQERSAMKVCTEACLFGGLIDASRSHRILDVGTGTGLLALMLAQRSEATIDAIDLDPDSVTQARANFESSPFASRLSVMLGDFREGQPSGLYDLIVANPPFFGGTLPTGPKARSLARHSDSLPLAALCSQGARILPPDGRLALLLPNDQVDRCIQLGVATGLTPQAVTRMRHAPGHMPNCAAVILKKYSNINVVQELTDSTEDIKDQTGQGLSTWSKAILCPYYLRI